jgi:hypothetical protein
MYPQALRPPRLPSPPQLPAVYIALFAMRGALIFGFCSAARALDRRLAARRAARAHALPSPHDYEGKPHDARSGHRPHAHSAHDPDHPRLEYHEPAGGAAHGHALEAHEGHPPAAKTDEGYPEGGHSATPDWRGMLFATAGGLRGAVSLIMAQVRQSRMAQFSGARR